MDIADAYTILIALKRRMPRLARNGVKLEHCHKKGAAHSSGHRNEKRSATIAPSISQCSSLINIKGG